MFTPATSSGATNDRPETPIASISFRGSLTVADAYAAISLAQPLGNKIAQWIVRLFFVAATIYLGWLTAYSYQMGETNLARMALASVLFFLLPSCFFVGREIWYRKRAKQLCQEGKHLYAPTTGEVDGQGIRSEAESGTGTLNWSAFCGYRAAKTVAVLYLHYPAPYVIMARTKFRSDQDWNDFLQLAGQKLTPR